MDARKPGLSSFAERVQGALETEAPSAETLRVARARLLDHVTGATEPAPRLAIWRRSYGALVVSAVLVVAVGVAVVWPRSISFVADVGSPQVGDVLEAARHRPLRVEFSEGSRLLLQEGSRARVLDTQTDGARVLLESGVADVSIAHRTGRATRWRFEIGPFQILVKGTQFELDWQPASQSLLLTMKAGTVELSGSCLPAPRLVQRGTSLRLSCAKPAPTGEPGLSAPPASAPSALAAAPEVAAPFVKARPLARERSEAPPSFEARCETADKTDLVMWANRARLTGNTRRARAALLVLRRRFPGSSEAGTAAFTLGRMAFDQARDYAEAARWFALCLAEQPSGPLLGDAAGRLLEAHERQGDRVAARRASEAYLRRFPDGPYASRARRILAD